MGVAGEKMEDCIVNFIKKHYNLLIGERTAEQIKIQIGNAFPDNDIKTMEIKGRDLVSGIPRYLTVNSDEIREAISEPVLQIIDAIKNTLENTPPELAGDIVDKGIMLAGGGALIKGLDQLIHQQTSLPVTVADDPLSCVALGAGKALDQLDLLKDSSLS